MNLLLAQVSQSAASQPAPNLVRDGGFWMPQQASTFAPETDFVFFYIFWLSAFFFVLINVTMFYFMWKYRRRTRFDKVGTITHSTPLELTWSILPSILLVPMFWWGFHGFMESRQMPATGTYDINVTAAKWSWTFTYPNGLQHEELHIPMDRPTKLIMRSNDVIHSFFIPEFRAKHDVVPGRYNYLWFYPTKTGEFHVECTEYCGTSHSDMHARVIVHPTLDGPGGVNDWLKNDADPYAAMNDAQRTDWMKLPLSDFKKKYENDPLLGPKLVKYNPPAKLGEELYKSKGCNQCHSTDGTVKTGPSWKGVFGHTVEFADGTSAVADENYLLESIKDPYKRIVKGFDRSMPANFVTLPQHQLDALIAYIKSLSDAGHGAPASAPASGSASAQK